MAAVSPYANAEFIIEVSNNRPALAPATKAKPGHRDLPPFIAASHKVVYTALSFDQADWPAGQQLNIGYTPCGAGARRTGKQGNRATSRLKYTGLFQNSAPVVGAQGFALATPPGSTCRSASTGAAVEHGNGFLSPGWHASGASSKRAVRCAHSLPRRVDIRAIPRYRCLDAGLQRDSEQPSGLP